MAVDLSFLRESVAADPGLVAAPQRADGLAAVSTLTTLLAQTLDTLHLNDDGVISTADMVAVSAAIQGDGALLAAFTAAHGNDDPGGASGFHLLQGAGGTLTFAGRSFVDKIADSLLHFGFPVVNGRILNEDGVSDRLVPSMAGWLNYFVNGQNIFNGTDGDDRLCSGAYSAAFADAANELFLAGAGNDLVASVEGNDTIWAGTGADTVIAGTGADLVHGEAGDDRLFGGDDADRLYGEAGRDLLDGGAGDDLLDGGDDADVLKGGAGADTILGGAGADQIVAGEGADRIEAGAGADVISLRETVQASDVLVFAFGDSGTTRTTMDRVGGFVSGSDKIDLTAFGHMTFETGGFSGSGASFIYDGHVLRIDANGDGVADMAIGFSGLAQLVAGDFLLA